MKYLIALIKRNQDGATIIEAALILPVFFFLIFAFLEIAITLFYTFVLESAMYDATRVSKVAQNPAAVQDAVRQAIEDRSFGILPSNEVVITTDPQAQFEEGVRNFGEPCRNDTNTAVLPDVYCPTCPFDFYVDENGNGLCDGPPELDLGGPGAVVVVYAFYRKPAYTPGIDGLLRIVSGGNGGNTGLGEDTLIRSSVVWRNEPITAGN